MYQWFKLFKTSCKTSCNTSPNTSCNTSCFGLENIEKLDVLENVIFDILARIKKENEIE